MAKVTFEFDEYEYRNVVDIITNRHALMCAIEELSNLYRAIYNGKIYDEDATIYLLEDGRKATKEDYEKANLEGKFLSGGKTYLSQDYIEKELDKILEDVRRFLWR